MTNPSNDSVSEAGPSKKSMGWWKLVVAVVAIGVGVFVAHRLGLFELLTMENIDKLDAWFSGLGIWAPLVFILVWIAACVFFLPGLPVTIVGGLVFGAVQGTIYSIIGATLGATMAFLVGRYAARVMVEGLVAKNKQLARIDEGVHTHGWRMLMITRLVPLFPFNAQNYVYGLTKISLPTYVMVSFVCMLPACAAFNFAAGSVRTGGFGKFFLYLAIAAVVLVILSLIPGWIKKRYAGDAVLKED